MRRKRLIAAAWLVLVGQASAADLREGFAAAVTRSAPLRALEVERDVLLARRDRADAWLPAAASVTLGYRTNQVLRDRGLREYEGEANAPLWLPGESRALRDSADAELAALDARVRRERLAVAGEVRADWWAWRAAQAAQGAARERVAQARGRERELTRQVAGGVLPQTDRLAAIAAVREAEAALREAERAIRETAIAFRALTGAAPSEGPVEATSEPAPGDPRLAAAEATVAAGQAAERLARARDRANPELALQLRHERDAFNEPYGTRLALLFTVPLGPAITQRERMAAAQATTTLALASIAPTERALRGGVERARQAVETAAALRAAAEARHRALAEQTGLFTAAWRGGELPLIEVLRARAALADADAVRAAASVGVGRAVSELNQALGTEPR